MQKNKIIRPNRKGRATKGNKRARQQLVIVTRIHPEFASVKKHTAIVKRLSNEIAKAIIEKGLHIDRGLVNQTALFHDVMKHLPDHELLAKLLLETRGSKKVAESIPPGHTVADYSSWPVEKK